MAGWFALRASYRPAFVAALKSAVDTPFRRWMRQDLVWLIADSYLEDVRSLCADHFSEVLDHIPERSGGEPRRHYRGRRVLGSHVPHIPASYRLLGVLPDAPQEVVAAAYRTLARVRHPDQGGSNEAMSDLNQAYARIRKERGWL